MIKDRRYHENGYEFIEELLPPEVISSFLSIMQINMGADRASQRRFLSEPGIALLPTQSYELPSAYFPFSLGLLWGLTARMEVVTKTKLLPSYAHGRIYPKGATCVVHNDRAANEHSLNLTLGFSDNTIWDFCVGQERIAENYLDNKDAYQDFGERPFDRIQMNAGDAVAYQGQHYYHGRIDPNPNAWSAHLFLGWVDRDGPQKDHAFDKFELPPPAKFFF
ncbi:MAG: hypothetical protein HKN14_09770 [Marinicaulis sp.]|nr:hypothetical protein [Marinicaulis sp.]NNL89217.1 hypothetical protein [Marinicaulis sp.]